MKSPRTLTLVASVAAGFLPLLAVADIRLPAERIVPVTFDREINVATAKPGDHFTATVVDEIDLPHNTQFGGEVLEVRQQRGDHPAFVDMEFRAILLPDGSKYDIRAIPIRLDAKYVHRDRDGHFVVDKKAIRKDNVVLGGAVGGFILGSLIKKPFEGTFLGILAGIVANESGAVDKANGVAVARGEKLGVLMEREAVIPSHGEGDVLRKPDEGDRKEDAHGEPTKKVSPPDNGNSDRPPYEPSRHGKGTGATDTSDTHRPADSVVVKLGDKPLAFSREDAPYYVGKTLMVPLMSTSKSMDVEVDKADGGRFYLNEGDSEIRLGQDSDVYRLNGKKGNLSTRVVVKDDVVYVPIEVFAALKSEPIFVNGVKIAFRA